MRGFRSSLSDTWPWSLLVIPKVQLRLHEDDGRLGDSEHHQLSWKCESYVELNCGAIELYKTSPSSFGELCRLSYSSLWLQYPFLLQNRTRDTERVLANCL